MAKVRNYQLSNIENLRDLTKYVSSVVSDIISTVNGRLEFDLNLKSETLEVTFSQANTDTTVNHKLRKTVVRFFVVDKEVSCDVYRGSGDPTESTIVLKCNQATTVTLVLF